MSRCKIKSFHQWTSIDSPSKSFKFFFIGGFIDSTASSPNRLVSASCVIQYQVNFKLLILRGLKILGRDQTSQKFEVYPVTGHLPKAIF